MNIKVTKIFTKNPKKESKQLKILKIISKIIGQPKLNKNHIKCLKIHQNSSKFIKNQKNRFKN